MFSRTRSFLRLASSQAVRWLALSGRLFALVAIAVSCLAPVARAETIAESVSSGTAVDPGWFLGQSVTTANSGHPWSNITFNIYRTDTGNPYAIGNIYLLDQAYAGTPSGLGTGTTGYISHAAASGGTTWIFDPSVLLQSNTQYFFYLDTGTGVQTQRGDGYAGGREYFAGTSGSAFVDLGGGFDARFTLDGTEAVPGPIPGAGLLSYLLVGFGGLAAFRKKLRARAGAVFAMLKLRWSAIALLNRGALKRALARA